MKIKLEIIEEEEKKKFVYFRNEFFLIKWKQDAMLEFGTKIQKTLDKRRKWELMLNNELQKRMKFKPKDPDSYLDPTEIPYAESLKSFIDAFKKKVKLREIPIQKTISESTKK